MVTGMMNMFHLSNAARRMAVLAALLIPMTSAAAWSPIAERLIPLDGIWEVYDADGMHTAPSCLITLSRKEIRRTFVVKGNAYCPIRPIAASASWGLYWMTFYDSSDNKTVSFPLHPDKDTYTSKNGEMVIRRASLIQRWTVYLIDISSQIPGGLAGAAITMMVIVVRRRNRDRRLRDNG